jgi:hypothetical protein
MAKARKLHTGAKGGRYYIRNGKRVYVSGKTTSHVSMMTGKKSKNPLFIDNVRTLI